MLHAVRNFNSFEIFAVTKCLAFESLQRGRKFDTFYRAPRKNSSFPVAPVDNLFLPEFLQSFVQPYAPQLLAPAKRIRLDTLNTRWEDDFFETTATETASPNNLETAWKLDISQARAIPERVIADLLQRTSRLEDNLF